MTKLRKEHTSRIGDERILGGTNFVEQVPKQDELEVDLRSSLEQAGWNLDRLINNVCRMYNVNEKSLLKKTRHPSSSVAKSLICYWGTEVVGLTAKEIAMTLGLSLAAVSYRVRMGLQHCDSNGIEFGELKR